MPCTPHPDARSSPLACALVALANVRLVLTAIEATSSLADLDRGKIIALLAEARDALDALVAPMP